MRGAIRGDAFCVPTSLKKESNMTSYQLRNDPYFLKIGVETCGKYNIAVIKHQEVDIKKFSLIPYSLTKANDKKNRECGVHFFLDDIRFKEVIDHPEQAFKRICDYKFLLSPQVSSVAIPMPTRIWVHAPMFTTLQIPNTSYRIEVPHYQKGTSSL